MGRERRWQHLIAPRDFSNYLDILLQAEQSRERSAHHRLIFRQEDPYHNRSSSDGSTWPGTGSSTRRRKPSLPAVRNGPASIRPPYELTRSLRPERPLPILAFATSNCRLRGPSLITSAQTVLFSWVSRMEQRRARLCRITLVTPSRTVQASTASVEGSSSPAECSTWHATPAAERICRAPSSSLSSRGCRYPATASRTSRKVWRAARSTSRISWIARAGSCSTRRPASSLLSVIMDRVCPSRSWRSRDRRCRSSV